MGGTEARVGAAPRCSRCCCCCGGAERRGGGSPARRGCALNEGLGSHSTRGLLAGGFSLAAAALAAGRNEARGGGGGGGPGSSISPSSIRWLLRAVASLHCPRVRAGVGHGRTISMSRERSRLGLVKRRLVVYEPKNMQQSETSEYAAWRRVSLEPHARARTCCPRRLRMRIFTEVAARALGSRRSAKKSVGKWPAVVPIFFNTRLLACMDRCLVVRQITNACIYTLSLGREGAIFFLNNKENTRSSVLCVYTTSPAKMNEYCITKSSSKSPSVRVGG